MPACANGTRPIRGRDRFSGRYLLLSLLWARADVGGTGVSFVPGKSCRKLVTLAWLGVLLRRIHLEEIHLHELFGADYEAYAARTVRLLPGIY